MLSIRVSDKVCLIPSEQVQHIDYVGVVTALPFTSAPIEGLTYFNGQLLLQIDVASALGWQASPQTNGKRLLVSTPQGDFALRVQEALKLASPKSTTTAQPYTLSLNEILPPSLTTKKSSISLKQQNKPVANSIGREKITALLVVSAGKTIALLTHNIDHIQDMTHLSAEQNQGDVLIKVKDNLLPTQSLAQLLGLKTIEAESIAIIVRGEQTMWALRVERVLTMDTVQQLYSSGMDTRGLWYVTQTGQTRELIDANNLVRDKINTTAPRLWYVTKEGQIQELVDAASLLGTTNKPLNITLTTPQQTAHALQCSERLTTEGLRIYCGVGSYLLPLSITKGSYNVHDLDVSMNRFPTAKRVNRANRIPWINATMLLFGTHSEPTVNNIVLSLPNNGQVLLNVERATLAQSVTALEKWLIVDLPYPASVFFDAACYDEQAQQWILRVVHTLEFSNLPWTIKKSLVKAIIGWFDRC